MLLKSRIKNPEIVLADFGAALIAPTGSILPKKLRGTLGYIAPEIISKVDGGVEALTSLFVSVPSLQVPSAEADGTLSGYSSHTDVWSLGATLHFMLTSKFLLCMLPVLIRYAV